jgi:hypothetical protein
MESRRDDRFWATMRRQAARLQRALCLAALLGVVACSPVPVADSGRSPSSGASAEEDSREPPRRTYHVQVRTVEEKAAADRTVSQVVAWFDALPRADRPEALSAVGEIPVGVRWKPPFYRVRVGPFSSREAARQVVEAMREEFPDAFIAREAVRTRTR